MTRAAVPARRGWAASAEQLALLALPFAAAGLSLFLFEWLVVVVHDWHLFLSLTEVLRYFGAGPWAPVGLSIALGGGGAWLAQRLSSTRARVGLALGWLLLVAPLLAWAFWSLSAGRRVRDLPGRVPGVLALAALGALASLWLVRRVDRAVAVGGQAGQRLGRVLALASALALLADAVVLRRLYPALHGLLCAASVLCAWLAGRLLCARLRPPSRYRRFFGPALGALLLATPLGVFTLRGAPNVRFVLEQAAPLTGKLLSLFPAPSHLDAIAPTVSDAPAIGGETAGLDLRGRDLLLISIDALRADRLRAYGGRGLTPNMDALARDGVVFERAYTTTPHTSYAVSSLLTGKYMRAVMELAAQASEHVTLPTVLRRYGYRTAAFYPPAIFFVDETRFASMAEAHLGFEYAKAMFADGQERVPQLEAYLSEVSEGHPVFAWVHLFEPHEPYDPDPAFFRGESPEARYDGEVAQADAAVGALVAAFRRARPDALVVLTADHGEEFGDHGGYHHGTTLFDEQVRVPLVFHAPGTLAPARLAYAVDTVDVVTTVLGLLGMPRDVRMRGDDLSPLLAGAEPAQPLIAFAAVDEARMATDGRFKAICPNDGPCQLFDLREDPRERNDLAGIDHGSVVRLRGQLERFVASVPEIEALAMAEGGGMPAALARARLGDPAAGPLLVPLLGAARASVRAQAARALGDLSQRAARPVLARLAESDPDPEVRAEAAIACLRLGDDEQRAAVMGLLDRPLALARRAALALAGRGDGAGHAVLLAAAGDEAAEEALRVEAIEALSALADGRSAATLVALLDDVRLRPVVARALSAVGGPLAVDALVEALAKERFPETRTVLARALAQLSDRRVRTLLERHLATDSGAPGGVALLAELGALGPGSAIGYRLSAQRANRRGDWRCEDTGCWPSLSAGLAPTRAVQQRAGRVRVVLRVVAEADGRQLQVGDQTLALPAGEQEQGVTLERIGKTLPVHADPGVLVQAVVMLPWREDIPPPAPEPWDGGVPPDPSATAHGLDAPPR